VRRYVLNLIVPLIAVGFAFAGIVQAQESANDGYDPPPGDCSPTITQGNLGYGGSMAVSPTGDVFVLEAGAGCIVRIDAAGVGHLAFGGGRRSDACPACGVNLGNPAEVEVGQDGTVYVLDAQADRVFAVAPDGTRTTIAENRRSYYRALTRDPDGRLYVLDFDQVFRLDPAGAVRVAGGGGADVAAGAPATSVRLDVTAMAAGPGGNLYLVEKRRHRVLRIDPAGMISLFAGTGVDGESGDGGPATMANIVPESVAADDAGNVYISVEYGHKVRRVDPAGIITTFAGRGASAYSGGALGDGGPATQAAFSFPTKVAVHDGNLYILDEGSRPRIRKVDKAGIITTLTGGQR
jgi:serine/threonine protein kinase, bacterial